jgi:hypothetical protein
MLQKIIIDDSMWSKIRDECFCASDVYNVVGLYGCIINGEIKSFGNMLINPKTYDVIANALVNNVKTKKHIQEKASKHLKKQLLIYTKSCRESMVRFDWMNFSPVDCDEVPINEIWYSEKQEEIDRIRGK